MDYTNAVWGDAQRQVQKQKASKVKKLGLYELKLYI